jgi:hypothetical protein
MAPNERPALTLVRVTFALSDWLLIVSRKRSVAVLAMARFRHFQQIEIEDAAKNLRSWDFPVLHGPVFNLGGDNEPNPLTYDREVVAKSIIKMHPIADWLRNWSEGEVAHGTQQCEEQEYDCRA